MAAIAFTINGQQSKVDVAPDTPLLWVVREHLKLAGTKYGCGTGLCGACTSMWTDERCAPARSPPRRCRANA